MAKIMNDIDVQISIVKKKISFLGFLSRFLWIALLISTATTATLAVISGVTWLSLAIVLISVVVLANDSQWGQ